MKRFNQLFVRELKGTLYVLYRRQFEKSFGVDAKPVPCLKLRTLCAFIDRRDHQIDWDWENDGPKRYPKITGCLFSKMTRV